MLPITTITAIGTTLAGIGFLGQLTFLWYIPVIFLKMLGYSTFRVRNDKDRVKGMLKILHAQTRSSTTIFEYGKTRPGGAFIGWQCFGYYIDSQRGSGDTDTEIVLFTTEKYFKEISEKSVVPCETLRLGHSTPTVDKGLGTLYPVTIWHRQGSYCSLYYRPLKIDMTHINPIEDQSRIVTDILSRYEKNKRLTVFVQGTTGAGKSTLGLLIAKQLRGAYCHDFNPTEPGDSFHSLIRDIRSEDNDPIVLVIEEINTMIRAIHDGRIPRHKNITTSITSKGSFNSFLDDMVFHKDVILIMTSNESKEQMDALDPSYLGPGRVNAYYTMMKQLST